MENSEKEIFDYSVNLTIFIRLEFSKQNLVKMRQGKFRGKTDKNFVFKDRSENFVKMKRMNSDDVVFL